MTTLFGRKGSILVEFAIGVPLLLACAAFMHDAPKYARMKSKMEFCAYCAINMIQNVSMNRENKKITLLDYRYISASAFLPYYGGGVRQYGIDLGTYSLPTGQMSIYYLKGTGVNKAKIMWAVIPWWGRNPTSKRGDAITTGTIYAYVHAAEFSMNTEYDAEEICKGLKINNGDVKIMLDLYLTASWCPDMLGKKKVPPSLWGLLFYSPEAESFGSDTGGWFHTYVVFTPKPGLFSETPPS